MADESSFLIEIVLQAIDKASPAINSLHRSVKELKGDADAKTTVDDLGRGMEDLGRKTDTADKSLRTHRSEVDQTGRSHATLASDLDKARSAVTAHTRGVDESTRAHRALRPEIAQTISGYEDFRKAINRGEISRKDASGGLQAFARDFRSFSRSAQTGSEDALRFGRMSEQAMKLAKSSMVGVDQGFKAIGREVRQLGSESGSASQAVKTLANTFDDWGVKIVSLSAALRGLGLALMVGLAQQLDSVVVGLAGGLTAVGSAAAIAAAGIGGALVSAIGQAIPAVTVLGAAVSRLKDIFAAAQQASKLQQDQFVSGAQHANQMASAAQAVSNAQESLKLSYQGLTDAQHRQVEAQLSLIDARRQARRQIEDLLLAEEQAKLAAEGATISLAQSQQQLQRTIMQGGTGVELASAQLQVQQAQLGLRQARVQVPRAVADAQRAQRLGVEGAPGVVSATQGAMTAQQGVQQAQATIQRDRAALAQAERTLSAGSGALNTAQRQLDYMLSHLDSAERELYARLVRIMNLFQGPNTPLSGATDALVRPFSSALGRIISILSDAHNPLMVALNNLGGSIGGALDRFFKDMLSGKNLQFFAQMADDAAKNLPIIIDSFGHILHLLSDIATAAAPVLSVLVQGFNTWITGLDSATSGNSGMARLKDFFISTIPYIKSFADLAGAFFRLFTSVIGDAAPAGKNAIDSFTRSINQATTWVTNHGPEVRRFFEQAVQVLSAVGQLVFQVAKAMVDLFDPETVATFVRFLTTYLLPALSDALKVLGFVVNATMEFFNLFGAPGRIVLEFLAAVTASLLIFGKVLGPILTAWRALMSLAKGKLPGGPGAGAAGEIETAITSGGTKAAEEMGTAIRTGGMSAAEEIRAALATGGATAGEEIGTAEMAAGATAGTKIGTAEVAGAAGAGGAGAATAGAEGAGAGILGAGLPVLGAALATSVLVGGDTSTPTFALHPPGMPQVTAPNRGESEQAYIASTLGLPPGYRGGPITAGQYKGPNEDPATAQAFLQWLGTTGSFGKGGFSPITGGGTSTGQLQSFKSELKNIGDVSNLSTTKLTELHDKAIQLSRLPGLGDKQRVSLENLARELDPLNVKLEKTHQFWAQTFGGISAATGNVRAQVKDMTTQDVKNIKLNFAGDPGKQAQAYAATFSSALETLLTQTSIKAPDALKLMEPFFRQLDHLKGKARENGAQAMEQMVRGMQSRKEITAQQAQDIIDGIDSRFQLLIPHTGNTVAKMVTVILDNLDLLRDHGKDKSKHASDDMASAVAEGASKFTGNITGGFDAVVKNLSKMTSGVGTGITNLNKTLNTALKALGVGGVSLGGGGTGAAVGQAVAWSVWQSLGGGVGAAAGQIAGAATGAYEQPRQGGKIIQVAEGGYPEVVLTTDPKHTRRQRQLLARYMQEAPHVFGGMQPPGMGDITGGYGAYAAGGYVFPYGAGLSQGRTDQGTDWIGSGNIAAIGDAHIDIAETGNSGWPGGGFVLYHLTDGPRAGAYVYVAENIQPLVSSGQDVKAGTAVAFERGSYPWSESGWADSSGQTLSSVHGTRDLHPNHSNTPEGIDFTNFIMGLSHGQIVGGAMGAAAAAVAQKIWTMIKQPDWKGPGAAFGSLGKGAMKKLTDAANQYGKKVVDKLNAAGISSGGVGGQSMDVQHLPGGWVRIGATEDTPQEYGYSDAQFAQHQAGGPSTYHGGWSYAELGATPGYPNYVGGVMAKALGRPGGATGLPYNFPIWARAVGGQTAYKAFKSDIGSGQTGDLFYGVDTHPPLAQAVGLPGKGPIEIKAAAGGFHGMVDRPTMFMTGEAGQEHVAITPMQAGGWAESLSHSMAYAMPPTSSFSGTVMDLSSLPAIHTLFQAVDTGFKALSNIGAKSTDFTKRFTPFVDRLLTQDTGVLDRLGAAFQVIHNAIAAAAVIGGRAAQIGFALPGSTTSTGFLSNRFHSPIPAAFHMGAGGVVRQVASPEQQQLDALSGAREEQRYMVSERNIVERALGQVSNRLNQARALARKDPKKYAGEVTALTAEYNNLVGRVQTLTGSIAQGISTIFQDEQARVQDMLTKVSDTYQTQQSKIQAVQSAAQAKGNLTMLPGLDKMMAASYQSQISALQPALNQAKKIGDTSLVNQIQQEIAQLQSSVQQALAQAMQDQISAADQAFQAKTSSLSSAQGIAQAFGHLSDLPRIDKMILEATKNQISTVKDLLSQAQAQGNTGAATQLQQELDGLQTTVAQTSAQLIQDQISIIQQGAQTDQSRVSELQSLAQTAQSQASTPAQFAAAGALNQQALQLNQQSLQGQLSSYNSLLASAIDQGNTGAVANITTTIDQLTAQLASNTAALDDNTAQVVAQTSSYIQSRGQFQTGVYGGIAQIIQTVGQLTGSTDVGALRGVYQQSGQSLINTNAGLVGSLGQLGGGASSLANLLTGLTDPTAIAHVLAGANISGIEAGHDATWIQTFEGVISSLEGNTEAIAQNNTELAKLNGQFEQPQSWSTTTWTAFRSAVFSGMGNLLPSFQDVLPPGSAPSLAPVFTAAPGSAGAHSPTIGHLSLTHPVEKLDPQVFGEQIAFEISNAP